ncbi:hypothetical protein [Corynebacterium sp. sy039]|uniref:hypothetical protein n=1 Tax=Corynebacterium sp. sy039 TaxID=2599641 RepID=UPI0011B60417|nr:hypothetical protein [Corynebacterium sp. sy039]QDZ43117.1 hypothetical protein FQV43_08120 [Corynebacterium sp. sy039]
MGDETQVTWQVQLSPLLMSEDHKQTSRGAQIMIPSTVKDVSIKMTHMPTEQVSTDDATVYVWKDLDGNIIETTKSESDRGYGSFVPAQQVDFDVPIRDAAEFSGDPFISDDNQVDKANEERYKVSPFYKYTNGKQPTSTTGADPSSFAYQPAWDTYQIGLNMPGIFTFEVTGTVEAVGEDTYVPIRADNMLWKCTSEGGGPGSPDQGCAPLKKHAWNRTGELPPVSIPMIAEDEFASEARKVEIEQRNKEIALENEKIAALYAEQGTKHGLTGVGACAVTRDTGRFDTISKDIEHGGYRYGEYVRISNLYLNPAVQYYGPLLGGEDNCDQGFQHITLCPDEETEVPPSEEPVESEEPTPSDEPQESEEPTLSEEEEVEPAKPSKETEEPTDSEAPTSSDEPVESEEPTPSEETQEPTPSESKPVKPAECPEEREEPVKPVVPPTVPDTDVDAEQGEVVTAVVEPEDKEEKPEDKPADSKPESKPAPKTVIAESVKDNVAKQAKTVAKKDRPKVTTGGHLRVA